MLFLILFLKLSLFLNVLIFIFKEPNMSNLFKNEEFSFKYPNNWKIIDDEIENCLAILNSDSGYSRVMVFRYKQEGQSMEYLKRAIEDIPKEPSLKILSSNLTIMGNKETHELKAEDTSHNPILNTHSLATIHNHDAYVFNFFGFGWDNPDKEGFLFMYKTLEFE